MSRPLITALPAYGPSLGGNHPKTLRGPVGKERPAGPRSHTGMPAYPRAIPDGRGDHPTYPARGCPTCYVATLGEFDSASPDDAF